MAKNWRRVAMSIAKAKLKDAEIIERIDSDTKSEWKINK